MKTLDKGQDKIKKICDALRKETLEPAEAQAANIIDAAQREAERIVAEARQQAETLHDEARSAIEQERNVFQSSLEQAARQGLEALKQELETKFFSQELNHSLTEATTDPKVISRLIEAIVKSVESEGIKTELGVVIPRAVSAEEVSAMLAKKVLDKLKEKSVSLGDFAGGAQVKLIDKKMTIDITEEAVAELLARYVRKDFRKLIFGS